MGLFVLLLAVKDGSIRMEEVLTNYDRQRRRPGRRQRGNSVVEMALVILPTFALVLGTIDYGMALFLKSTFQNAVREGVRYAVTYQTQGGNCQDNSIRLVVQTYALGFLGNTTTPNTTGISVKYFNPANLSAEVLGPTGNFPGNIVEVSINNYQWKWISILSGTYTLRDATPMSIIAYSSDRLGGLPGGTLPPCR
ncbi:MAG: pilus assembly protein [Acidobacteria bacterium]|nr:pilus assembly protein [Acidobacteriota bacterium]